MISKILELILVTTSISPVFLAVWFSKFTKTGNIMDGIFWLILFLAVIPISWAIIKFSERKLEVIPVHIKSIAPADKEVTAFLIAYILPLIGIVDTNFWTVIFIIVLLFIAVLTTSNYHFNPVLSLFLGYHYYEITIESEVNGKTYTHTYILMTKKTLKHCREVRKVVQISDYMLMEVEA